MAGAGCRLPAADERLPLALDGPGVAEQQGAVVVGELAPRACWCCPTTRGTALVTVAEGAGPR